MAQVTPPPPRPHMDSLEEELARIEKKFSEAHAELRGLRALYTRKRDAALKDLKRGWRGHEHRLSAAAAAGAAFLFVCSFYVWSLVGQTMDAYVLPAGSDAVLDRLPVWDLVPVLTVGWLLTHTTFILLAVVYAPRRWAFLIANVGSLILTRTLFVALNPLGAPEGMLTLNASYLLAPLRGVLAFENEFFFSGHTALPFLYALILWDWAWARRWFLGLSGVMAVSVLITRNHYTMDVLGAYFITYGVYKACERWLAFLDPEARP